MEDRYITQVKTDVRKCILELVREIGLTETESFLEQELKMLRLGE